jgi:hypothetical protein
MLCNSSMPYLGLHAMKVVIVDISFYFVADFACFYSNLFAVALQSQYTLTG